MASAVPAAPVATRPSATATAGHPDGIEARITDLPATLGIGAAPVEFSIVLTDDAGSAAPSVSPLFQLTGSTGSAVPATVERLDPDAGRWVSVPVSDDDSAPIGAAGKTPYSIPAGGSLTVHYRISVPAGSQPQDMQSYFFVVGADGRQLATASQPVRVAAA
ncbi:hypothetical protein [Kitasatospora sp. LaBMicrA B282]|uniref:hypothetical protein n=1 Tax=Kitasatospora sp. LaBMicrA B282 TaxID=3420949 RepID=UPI003D138C8D